MSFSITAQPLDGSRLTTALHNTVAGACVTFEGWVRRRNDGEDVNALEYEAYTDLAVKEGERILAEARERFALVDAMAVHRVGRLELGDMAVWVGGTSGHRDAAFHACRYIIDETKARVPIWKKEHYASGATEWINCASRSSAQDSP